MAPGTWTVRRAPCAAGDRAAQIPVAGMAAGVASASRRAHFALTGVAGLVAGALAMAVTAREGALRVGALLDAPR